MADATHDDLRTFVESLSQVLNGAGYAVVRGALTVEQTREMDDAVRSVLSLLSSSITWTNVGGQRGLSSDELAASLEMFRASLAHSHSQLKVACQGLLQKLGVPLPSVWPPDGQARS